MDSIQLKSRQMKNLFSSIFLCLFGLLVTAQTGRKPFKPMNVEAQRWSRIPNTYPWQYYETRVVDSLINYKQSVDKQNKYGSTSTIKRKATGFFHVEKINGRWWVIDPEGYGNIQRVINTFQKGKSELNIKAFNNLFKTDSGWVKQSAIDFSNIGINGVGAWSDVKAIQQYNNTSKGCKISYSLILNMLGKYSSFKGKSYDSSQNSGFTNMTIFIFDPRFENFCDSMAKADLSKFKDDHCLFGYFSDNELPFSNGNLTAYLTLKYENDPARVTAEKWLKEKGLLRENITNKEKSEFAGFVADKYFSIVSKAIRKSDPNHMYLGSRVHWDVKFNPDIMMAAGKYCDVVSINYYTVWSPEKEHLENWAKWTNRPFIITEFYTKGMDSGLANTTGAGWNVRSQKDRGYSYQDFCLALLESKSCVGWHYFKYQDNDPTAKNQGSSNIDSNKGIVNNDYKFYTDMTNEMKQLNKQVYSLINYFDN